MVTVLRAAGLRVVIYLNDHEPAHVHVFGDGVAKINLSGPGDTPEAVWTNMRLSEFRRALRLVAAERSLLLTRWKEIHARTDRR